MLNVALPLRNKLIRVGNLPPYFYVSLTIFYVKRTRALLHTPQ